jgi:hypothetical protein
VAAIRDERLSVACRASFQPVTRLRSFLAVADQPNGTTSTATALSLVVGLELLNRLAAVCDVKRGTGGDTRYAFPAPRDVARLPPASCHAVGFSQQKVRALLTLAHAIEKHDIDVELLAREDDDEVCARLLELRGVGRWTAGTEWIRLSPLSVPKDRIWTAKDDARYISPLAALPGYRHTIGVARSWHFLNVYGFIITGLIFVSLLFSTTQWQRLVPTSGTVFVQAWSRLCTTPISTFRLNQTATTDTTHSNN